ncbi:MAG: arginase [Methylococcales bacterium]
MSQTNFESLYHALSSLPRARGVVLAHVISLPEPLRGMITQLMRRCRRDAIALSELADELLLSQSEANLLAAKLTDKGFLQETTADTGAILYQVRYGYKQGTDWPLAVRQALLDVNAIQLIEVKSDLGAGTRGANLGPDALKVAAFQCNRQYFADYPAIEIRSTLSPRKSSGSRHANNIEKLFELFERVGSTVAHSIKEGRFPILIAGDHSTAAATMAGIKLALPDSRLGVVWIDAHADIHSPYTTPSGNLHGMPVAAALGEDNLAAQINHPQDETIKYWEAIKNLGCIAPKFQYGDLVYVAVRDTEAAEDLLIDRHRIRNFTTAEVRNKGVGKVAREALGLLAHCDRIYISFDVDSMDSSVSEGTGTPVAGGLTELEAGDLILSLLQEPKVCCFEICEVNPTLDERNRMAENAFDILARVTDRVSADYT